jgi:NitT/TauT family transport system ATP-binding protein
MKLSIQAVSKKFAGRAGEVHALSNVCLEVQEHEFVILVGASGCGKSTLLNIVAGLEEEFEGQVLMDGNPVLEPGPERAMVFQDGALFPWLTVVKNVEFGLKRLHVSANERREKALDYLEIVGLSKVADGLIHELSGGMRQRVAIARALAVEPQVLLMDEPFSALDAQTREDLYVELQKIWQRTGATILFVTHNVREAVTLGDRVILIRRPTRQDGVWLPSIQNEMMISLPRPRHIDDVEVTKLAKELSLAMREGRAHANPDEYDDTP